MSSYDDWKLATPPYYDDPETPEEVLILESARKYIRKQIEDIKSEIDVLKDRIEDLEYADDYLCDALGRVRDEYQCGGCGQLMDKKGKYCSRKCYQEQHEDEGRER